MKTLDDIIAGRTSLSNLEFESLDSLLTYRLSSTNRTVVRLVLQYYFYTYFSESNFSSKIVFDKSIASLKVPESEVNLIKVKLTQDIVSFYRKKTGNI